MPYAKRIDLTSALSTYCKNQLAGCFFFKILNEVLRTKKL